MIVFSSAQPFGTTKGAYFFWLFLGVFFLMNDSFGQQTATALSPRTANYNIDLVLDTTQKQVQATQVLTFNNPSGDTIWTMPFHLYYNAFKNNKTLFMRNGGRVFISKSQEDLEAGNWPYIHVKQVRTATGILPADSIQFIYPDVANPDDHTVLEIRLVEPILPYSSYSLTMEWQSSIPKASIRTGYNRDYYFMVQWYPKLGVYEPTGTRFAKKGQWNCHQYHPQTEYYGEFGVYDVTMDVPLGYVVGGSGYQVSSKEQKQRKIVHYRAEDVIDFAWTASPHFLELHRDWKGVDVKLLIMPEHVCNKERFYEAAFHTLDFFEEYLEKYPYPSLTIVSPPYYGLFSGAMEYPTLFTAPTLCLLPPNVRTTQTLTMHELTHQYFMQMLSTNEQEEAWLDEGFTAFFEAKMMDKFYPKGVFYWEYLDWYIGSMEYRRGRFLNSDNINIGPMSQTSWQFKHGGQRQIFYGKGAMSLATLEGLVGTPCFKAIMKTYFQRWKFKHPSRLDFITVVQEQVRLHHPAEFSVAIDDYLDQVIYETTACDYAVHSISNNKIDEPVGYFEDWKKARLPLGKDTKEYQAKTILYRLGGLQVPQEVRITFDDGSSILEHWDGRARSHDFTYVSSRKIVSVHIDPAFKIPLDKNVWNNSYTLQPTSAGVLRYSSSFFTWMEGLMVTLSLLI
ncbi:MAG: M1 family metallopeptidase [Aureispira sp.]